jgi:hypothetical protein
MKKIFVIIAIILPVLTALSQGLGEGKRTGIHLSNSINYGPLNSYYKNNRTLDLIKPEIGLAFSKTPKKLFYIKTGEFYIKQDKIRNYEKTHIFSSIKFCHDRFIRFNESKKIIPSIGYIIEPFYHSEKNVSTNIRYNSFNFLSFGTMMYFTPKINYFHSNFIFYFTFLQSILIGFQKNKVYNLINSQGELTNKGFAYRQNRFQGLEFGLTYLFPSKTDTKN